MSPGYSFKQPEHANTSSKEKWSIFPNPTKGSLVVNVPEQKAGRYELADVLGRTLMSGTLKEGIQRLNLSNLAPGQYMLKLHGADGSYAGEMVIKE